MQSTTKTTRFKQVDLDPPAEAWHGLPSGLKQVAGSVASGLFQLRCGAEPSALVEKVADSYLSRLDPKERGFLLMIAARCAEPDDLDSLASAVLARTGMPIVPLDSIRADAKLWAAEASPSELRAYCAAIWHRLSARDRATFLATVSP